MWQPLQSLFHMKEPSATATCAPLRLRTLSDQVVVHSRPCGSAEVFKFSLKTNGNLFCEQLWADQGALALSGGHQPK